ncbi:hypothetical protein C8F01DRAFT_1118485 [Mycena amicta]|nr:hypothetical protein C8F01DRAFT_1118485 [Mycena amicta]
MPSPARLNNDSPAFQPRLGRTDTTTAQVGTPKAQLDERSMSLSDKSANTSFPLSESALPTTFDTSDDIFTNQLSHFFPLPPTKATASTYNSPMTSLNDNKERVSLQESLDAIWAPPKHNPVRISAPPTPVISVKAELEPLIDLSSDVDLPTMPSLTAASSTATITALSFNTSFDTSFGPVASSPKRALEKTTYREYEANKSTRSILMENGEAIPSPVTYADATNIATKYPELASKVLKAPLDSPSGTPLHARRELQPEEFDSSNVSVLAEKAVAAQAQAVVPVHTPDRPNWALAPEQDPAERSYSREYRRQQPRRESEPRQQKPTYAEGQDGPDDKWTFGQRGSDAQSNNNNNDDDYRNARNGQTRRGWGQDEANDSQTRDEPPHMGHVHPSRARNLSGFSPSSSAPASEPVSAPSGGAENWSANHDGWATGPGSSGRRTPQATNDLSFNQGRVASPQYQGRVASPQHQGGRPSSADWTPTHDPWVAQQSPQRRQEPLPPRDEFVQRNHSPARSEGRSQQRLQGDDWTPNHDGRSAQSARDAPNGRASPMQQRDEWTPSHDPWTDGRKSTTPRNETRPLPPVGDHDSWNGNNNRDENQGRQSRMLEPEEKHPEQRRKSPSPFRDRMNDNNAFGARDRSGSVNDNSSFAGEVLEVRRAPAQSSIAALAAARANDSQGNHRTEFDYFGHSDTMAWTDSAPAAPATNMFSPTQRIASPTLALPRDYNQNRISSSYQNPNDNGRADNSFNSRGHSVSRDNYNENQRPDSFRDDNTNNHSREESFKTRERSASRDRRGSVSYDNGDESFDSSAGSFMLGAMKSDQPKYDNQSRRGSADDSANRWGPSDRNDQKSYNTAGQQDLRPYADREQNHVNNKSAQEDWGRNDSQMRNERGPTSEYNRNEREPPSEYNRNERGPPSEYNRDYREYNNNSFNDDRRGDQQQQNGGYNNNQQPHLNRGSGGGRQNDSFGSSNSSSPYRRGKSLPSQQEEFNRYCDAHGFGSGNRFGGRY